MLNAVLAAAQLVGMIALLACYTGLTSQDYTGGCTLRKLFKLPAKNRDERNKGPLGRSQAEVNRLIAQGRVLRSAALLIVDEVPMAGKDILPAINDLLKDLHRDEDGADREIANKLLIMSGDFEQTSPIVAGGDRNGCMAHILSLVEL